MVMKTPAWTKKHIIGIIKIWQKSWFLYLFSGTKMKNTPIWIFRQLWLCLFYIHYFWCVSRVLRFDYYTVILLLNFVSRRCKLFAHMCIKSTYLCVSFRLPHFNATTVFHFKTHIWSNSYFCSDVHKNHSHKYIYFLKDVSILFDYS